MRNLIIALTCMSALHGLSRAQAQTAMTANTFGRTAANITACPARNDYLRFYALLDDDVHAAFTFAHDHKCVELEGETTVKINKIVSDTSCVLPPGSHNCVWTSSHRIKGLVDSQTKTLIDDVNQVFDRNHPECKRKTKPDYCN